MFDSISAKINADIISKLNNLLLVVEGYSGLERLKTAPMRASVEALLNLTSRLKIIEDTGALAIKLDLISNNYQKIFTREIRIYSITRIRGLETTRKHTALICFLHQIYQDNIDFLVLSRLIKN